MKKILKSVFVVCLSFFMFMGGLASVSAAEVSLDESIAQLIYYHTNNAETDELRVLSKIKEISEEEYQKWNSVRNYWNYLETEMHENIDVAPDGLPQDDSHAFVVLGFALKSDGTMEDELVGRLQVALASAQKYPNSYVLVTGGVMKNGWTEGDRMYDWLIANGLDSSRIIKENLSATTVQNAQFSYDKLYNQYNVSKISLITSQYHLKRGMLLYFTESISSAKKFGKTPIEIVSNAGWYRADKTSEPTSLKANSLTQIAGGDVRTIYATLNSTNTPTSVLQSLSINGVSEYEVGTPLNLSISATYDIEGFQRDVTSLATISGYDANKVGKQVVSASYTENGVTQSATFNITVKETIKANVVPPKAPATGDATNSAPLIAILTLSAFAYLLVLRKKSA